VAAFPDVAITSIGPASGMLDVARTAVPGADFVDGTAEDLSITAGSVDLVVIMSFHHWHDQRQSVSEVAQVLSEDGTLLLRDLVASFWTSPFVSLAGGRSRMQTLEELTALLRSAQVDIRRSIPVRRTAGVVR
jgi:ubiquinone/menaquinone biosynthesis C-methylase UbiE